MSRASRKAARSESSKSSLDSNSHTFSMRSSATPRFTPVCAVCASQKRHPYALDAMWLMSTFISPETPCSSANAAENER
jgi:hypothetical protein